MIEKEVQKKIAVSAQVLGLWYFKIPDSPVSMGFDSKIRFAPVKPCDCIIASQGKVAFLELKATRERRIPFACIRKESQERHMNALVDAGIPTYLLVYWTPGERLFAFPWEWWSQHRESATRKSIELDLPEIERYSVKEATIGQRLAKDGHAWGGKWAWDLRPLLGIVADRQMDIEEAA